MHMSAYPVHETPAVQEAPLAPEQVVPELRALVSDLHSFNNLDQSIRAYRGLTPEAIGERHQALLRLMGVTVGQPQPHDTSERAYRFVHLESGQRFAGFVDGMSRITSAQPGATTSLDRQIVRSLADSFLYAVAENVKAGMAPDATPAAAEALHHARSIGARVSEFSGKDGKTVAGRYFEYARHFEDGNLGSFLQIGPVAVAQARRDGNRAVDIR